jgi:hypothetical protein
MAFGWAPSANWPHVVEYQEINRTLTTATWGPDPHLLTDLLTQPLTAPLTDAIEAGASWLRAALCAIADSDTSSLDADAIDWLERLADPECEQPGPAERWARVDLDAPIGSVGDDLGL